MQEIIDSPALEAELSQLNAQLRELRGEARAMEEKKLLGHLADDQDLIDLKAQIARLSDRQNIVIAQLRGEPIETKRPLDPILDFIADYKLVIWGIIGAGTLAGLMILLVKSNETTEEERKAVRESLMRAGQQRMLDQVHREGGVDARIEMEDAMARRGNPVFGGPPQPMTYREGY
jgi:hypothetical protein